MKKPCPRNEQELQAAYRSSPIAELNHDNEELYDYLTTHTGLNITNVTAVEFLYNTLEIEASQGISILLYHNLKANLPQIPFLSNKFYVQGDAGGNVSILAGDSIGHYEKKVYMKAVWIYQYKSIVNGDKQRETAYVTIILISV